MKICRSVIQARLPSRQDAFTLIEVMVALAILALSLTAMAVTMSGALNNATTLRERTYASWIAQNKIVEMRLSDAQPRVGETSGEVDYANSEWFWSAIVAETGIENLWRVDVSVSWPDSDESIRTVTGFVGVPAGQKGISNQAWGAHGATR